MTHTVQTLIEALARFPPELPVVLQLHRSELGNSQALAQVGAGGSARTMDSL